MMMVFGRNAFCLNRKTKKEGFFILLDMMIALILSSFCLMLVFSGLEQVEMLKSKVEDLKDQRNLVTSILPSKYHYIQNNHLEKDRSYEIFPDVFVDIYCIEFDKNTQQRYGLEKVEFGIIEERKGE